MASQRLLAIGVAAGGFRVLYVNAEHAQDPVRFVNWFDAVTTVSTIALMAASAIVFLGVYLFFRYWPKD